MKPSLLFAAAVYLVLAAAAAEAAQGSFTAEHLVRIDRVGAPVVSPDGRQIVYAVRHTDLEADRGRYDLWLTTLDGAETRRLTTHEANDTSPAWSADGEFVYFLSSRSGSNQVWRLPLVGGEAEAVTELPLDVGSFRLAADGRRMVVSLEVFLDCADLACTVDRVAASGADPVSAQAYDQLFMRHWDHWLDGRRAQLFALALNEAGRASVDAIRLTRLDADVPSRVWGGNEEYAIAPDGQALYFAARLRNAEEPTSTNFDLYRVAMDGSGALENLTVDNPAWDTAPALSPDGRTLVWLAMKRPGFEADRFAVMARDLSSGATRELAPDWDRSPSSVAFSRDGKSLLMSAQDVGNKTLWRLALDSGEITRLTEQGSISAFDEAADGTIVIARNDLGAPTELYRLADDGVKMLTAFGARVLDGVAMGGYEPFTFAGADGATVHGWLVRPVDFHPDRRYPIAFLIHGGPQGSFSNSFHYRWNPQTYAGQGFAALMIDFHGSTGYGQDFTDSISGDWGGKPLEDLKLGLAAALERYDYLDGDRVCALGASYGGYMVNWIAGQWPDRFDCLVNHDGIFDNRSMYYATEELWFPEWEHGGPYFANPQGYEKHNPARFVDRWQTPMLVIHGELDYRVPVTQGIATFTALQRRGIESRFLYFPDENHWVLRPANSVRWHHEVNAWLKRFLVE
ncbi:MAG: S9 family peptidase [Wenzhouxiangellaceae bacterium]|nr:S9 family peptidase [Wenzhouxiangellaceae bacterium]